uniref:Uncharacterized protein n=1 Tax=Myotis myotis TaxID=51298 RepID=A0A7J7SR36_MYOMY|nr:hypothetical protein mMyoMyo1_009286 [Myotis myotis]
MQVAECPLVDELRLWAVQRLLRKPRTFVTELTVHASCPTHACSPECCPGCSWLRSAASSAAGHPPDTKSYRGDGPHLLSLTLPLARGGEGAATHPQALHAQNTSPRPSVLLVVSKTDTAPGLDSGRLCRRPQPRL